MAVADITPKRLAISKANAQMVAVVAAASFIAAFSLVAAGTVWSQIRYQARVTTAKNQANQQLKKNIEAYSTLVSHYKDFDSATTNIIGGNANGTGDKDGKNSRIVLDALPSAYDFPGLTSSLEKILTQQGLKVSGITGTDDQINQQNNTSSPTPQPVNIPFTFSVSNTSYASVEQLVASLQQSIRPIQVDSLDVSGSANNMTVTVNAHTYYQPAKSLSITKKVVK